MRGNATVVHAYSSPLLHCAVQLTTTGALVSKIQLSISCSNLPNMDKGGNLSDPFVVVKTRAARDAPWQEVGRTEVVANNLSPQVKEQRNETTLHCSSILRCSASFLSTSALSF